MGEKFSLWLTKANPFLAIIFLQFGFSGMFIVASLGLKTGMSHYVLATYRHVFATLVIAPFALVLEIKIRPKMTVSIFLRIMVLGFLEPVFDQNLYYVGLGYTSATFASASINVLPAITFIMAIIFRLELLNLKKFHSVAKVIGTVITVSGAMVMTLYKGPALEFFRFRGHSQHARASQAAADQHWALGTMLLLASCGGWSAFFILQSFTLKKYPAELSLVTWICLMGTLQNAVLSFTKNLDNF